jgi:hypothetical protein
MVYVRMSLWSDAVQQWYRCILIETEYQYNAQ